MRGGRGNECQNTRFGLLSGRSAVGCLYEHLSRLLTGNGIDEEILHEYLRCSGVGDSVNRFVLCLDVDCSIDNLARATDLDSLAVGLCHTIALRSRCHDDELEILG